MKVSLIISTYNRPDALAICLTSVLKQTRMPDEVIIGDDGSRDDTRRLIEDFASRFPVPLIHLWHEDDGFRLAAMRNKCIARATGDYILQIDGDVILSRHFVADHIAAAKPGFYIKGSRVRLNEKSSARICDTGRFCAYFSPCSLSLLKDREKAIRLPRLLSVWLSHRYHTTGTGLGANLSFWRNDLLKVNGYDESFTGWGAEDNDIELRLQASGVKTFKLFRCGLVRHLWHKETPNPRLHDAYEYMKQKIARGEIVSKNGVDKYL